LLLLKNRVFLLFFLFFVFFLQDEIVFVHVHIPSVWYGPHKLLSLLKHYKSEKKKKRKRLSYSFVMRINVKVCAL